MLLRVLLCLTSRKSVNHQQSANGASRLATAGLHRPSMLILGARSLKLPSHWPALEEWRPCNRTTLTKIGLLQTALTLFVQARPPFWRRGSFKAQKSPGRTATTSLHFLAHLHLTSLARPRPRSFCGRISGPGDKARQALELASFSSLHRRFWRQLFLMPVATSPSVTPRLPSTKVKMDDRKRPAIGSADDLAPPSKRQAVNGGGKSKDDSGDTKEEAWIDVSLFRVAALTTHIPHRHTTMDPAAPASHVFPPLHFHVVAIAQVSCSLHRGRRPETILTHFSAIAQVLGAPRHCPSID